MEKIIWRRHPRMRWWFWTGKLGDDDWPHLLSAVVIGKASQHRWSWRAHFDTEDIARGEETNLRAACRAAGAAMASIPEREIRWALFLRTVSSEDIIAVSAGRASLVLPQWAQETAS